MPRLRMTQRSIEQIKGRHVMCDVHDRHFWIDLENDSLYGPDQMVVGTVVGSQCDDGVGHEGHRPGRREAPEVTVARVAEIVIATVGKPLGIDPRLPTPGSPKRRAPKMTRMTETTG